MALADKLEEMYANRRRPSKFCAYISMYNNLSPENKKALDDAWAKGIPTNVIVAAIRAEGIKTSSDSVRNHKNGICKCPKK